MPGPKGPVGLRAVARLAEVSAATASRALRPGTPVAAATRDRVLAAARALDYAVPRVTELPVLIAVLARFPNQWYFAEAHRALEERLGTGEQRIVLHNLSDAEGRRRFFDQVLPRGHVDGVVVVSTSFDEAEQRALDGLGVPIVVVGGHVPGRPTFGIDEQAAARTATEHLIGLGHRQVGMISFDPDDPVGQESTAARTRGFHAALTDSGLTVEPDWIIPAAGSRMAGGVAAAELLLSRPRLPTAIFAMSDELAIGALRALRRAQLRVPGHLSVVGFDDHEMAEFLDLTTVHQPVGQQARAAADVLTGLQAQGERSPSGAGEAHVPDVRLPVRLVVRGTTGPPGAGVD